MITYREAKKGELCAVAKLTAETFGEYPMFDIAFRDCFRSERAYLKYMERLHRVNIRALADKNKCFIGVMDGKIVSAALLESPNIGRITARDFIKHGGLGLMFPVGLKRLGGFFGLSELARKSCEESYPNSWYLELLVVDGAMKGHGLGGAMIEECIKPYVLSRGGDSITLITNTERNCAFYRKHGFEKFAYSELSWHGCSAGNWSFRWTL